MERSVFDGGEAQVRALPAYRRTVWGFRLLLASPLLMVLAALSARLLPVPVSVVPLVVTFGAGGVGMALCWASYFPLMRFQREVLGTAGMDMFESGNFIWRLIFRDTFHRRS